METFYTAMENTLAHMILFMNRKQQTDGAVLAGCSDSRMIIDEDIRTLKDFMIFTASPAYALETGKDDSFDGMISCDAYIYHIVKTENGRNACGLKITRMDVGVENRRGEAVIRSLCWYTVQDMEPWIYAGDPGFLGMEKDCPSGETGENVSSETFCAVKKQINRIWDRLQISTDKRLRDMFCVPGGLEPPSDGPFIGITASPAVWMAGEGKAQAWYPAELFGLGGDGEKSMTVCRCFYYVFCEFSRGRDGWSMTGQWSRPFLRLPDTPYRRGKRYDKISVDMIPWTLRNEPGPGDYPEDSYAIENIINAWAYTCRRGRLCEFYETYMKNSGFTPGMLIKSQGEKTAKLNGEKEILHKLSDMDARYHPGMYTFHTATTPLIEISVDGRTAVGTWFDHSATNLSGSAFEDSKIPYMVFVARYRHHFRKIDGKWFLTDFFWEPLISLQDWSFDRKHSGGLAARKNAVLYPEAFSSDIYSCK